MLFRYLCFDLWKTFMSSRRIYLKIKRAMNSRLQRSGFAKTMPEQHTTATSKSNDEPRAGVHAQPGKVAAPGDDGGQAPGDRGAALAWARLRDLDPQERTHDLLGVAAAGGQARGRSQEAGSAQGRPDRHLEPERDRVAGVVHGLGQGGTDRGRDQPRLPVRRARLLRQENRRQGRDRPRVLQEPKLCPNAHLVQEE